MTNSQQEAFRDAIREAAKSYQECRSETGKTIEMLSALGPNGLKSALGYEKKTSDQLPTVVSPFNNSPLYLPNAAIDKDLVIGVLKLHSADYCDKESLKLLPAGPKTGQSRQ